MRTNLLKLVFFCFAIFTYSACKKSSTDNPTPKTKTEYLTSGSSKTWKISSAKFKNADNIEGDLLLFKQDCIKDNVIIFKSTKAYEIQEGKTKCNATDPTIMLTSTWSFANSETTLVLDKFSILGRSIDKPEFKITTLDDKVFEGTTIIVVSGITYTLTLKLEPAA